MVDTPQQENKQLATDNSFKVIQRTIKNPYRFQLYIDHGHTEIGPWAKIGLNDTEYVIGFAPTPVQAQPHLRVAEV